MYTELLFMYTFLRKSNGIVWIHTIILEATGALLEFQNTEP